MLNGNHLNWFRDPQIASHWRLSCLLSMGQHKSNWIAVNCPNSTCLPPFDRVPSLSDRSPEVIWDERRRTEGLSSEVAWSVWLWGALIDVMMLIKAKHLGCGEGYAPGGHVWQASTRQAMHKGCFCPRENVCRGLEQVVERAPHIAKHYHCERLFWELKRQHGSVP